MLAGVVVCANQADHSKLYETNKLTGGVLSPFEAWLAMRGLKTLPLRMQRQCENALMIARSLQTNPRIQRVIYPGLIDHPDHSLAQRLLEGRGYGGVISFEIAGADKAEVFQIMDAFKLCQAAATLGDIYSLILHPASSSHRALTPTQRQQAGIPDNLLRLSCGIEDPGDILQDILQALEKT